MNKRGISNVIVTLIIIVISLVAIGLVWGVVRNIISEGAEDISLAGFKINIKISSAGINGNNINVNVKRNVGEGNLTGIKFIFTAGEDTEAKERTFSLKELESKAFDFTLNDLNISEVESVSIAPKYLSGSGKETLGNIMDTYNIVQPGSGGTGGNGGNGGNGGSGGSCIPDPDPCGTFVCGTVANGTCGTVSCGTCTVPGESCVGGSCVIETTINTGIVNLTWPPEMNLFFDSYDLSTTQSYTGNFVKFPGSAETRCLLIIDHIFPSNPIDYNKSFVRLGTPNNEKSFVSSGDNYEVWASSSCGA